MGTGRTIESSNAPASGGLPPSDEPQPAAPGSRRTDGLKLIGISTVILMVALLAWIVFFVPSGRRPDPRVRTLDALLAAPPLPALPADSLERGGIFYGRSCLWCHGPSGEGAPPLGNDLTRSGFIATVSDQELREFLREGRAADAPDNRMGMPMPGMGGQVLSDEDLDDIVNYLRALQDPRRFPPRR
jgi:mono/diheme cytochrome c family protein